MLNTYLILALRNMRKRPGLAALHLLGLTTGMACSLMILQYVFYERSYDRFHPKADQICRLELDCYQKNVLSWKSATVYPAFGPTIKKDFPEVEDFCRLHDAEYVMSNPASGTKFAEKKGYYADPATLRMFNINMRSGNPESALDGPDKLVLSEKMARKYFGNTDVLGKSLVLNDHGQAENFEISGVFENYPENAHLDIEYLISYKTLAKIEAAQGDTTNSTETSFGWYDFYTYFQLQQGTDLKKIESKFPAYLDRYVNKNPGTVKAEVHYQLFVQPLTDIHLYSNLNQEAEVNGDGKSVLVLFLAALFILGIAWVNYINLATARAAERAREVGVRKAAGARRGQLIGQFLIESLLLNSTALTLAVATVALATPAFSHFVDKNIPFSLFAGSQFIWLIGVFALGTLLSGLYPAFVLSGFRPAHILKGSFKNSNSGIALRRSLIVGQFTASIALIIGTIVVYRQVNFMQHQQLGFDRTQTLVLEGPHTLSDSLYPGVFGGFKQQVLQVPGIQSITGSSSVPGDEIYWTNSFRRKADDTRFTMYLLGVDEAFIPAYDMHVLAGRNFEITDKQSAILNESAAKLLGFESPEKAVGEIIQRGRRDSFTVRGVLRDFHHQGLQKAVDPMVLVQQPDQRNYYSLKVNTKDLSRTIASVEKAWAGTFPNDPYRYFFLDEFFDRQYKSDLLFGKVFGFFALMAILVACLGLLGLTSYNILQRAKEIGIRKVLGASSVQVVGLLSKDLLKLVVVAIVVATPLAWYVMNHWLQDFAYHIDVEWWMFLAAGALAVLVALLTVSFQSFKAAMNNPVKSLRSD